MSGRFREICAGVNCDLGTAAAFREQWKKESDEGRVPIRLTIDDVQRRDQLELVLEQDQAPGDAVVMTAAVHSLHRAHPGKYLTAVRTPYPEVFDYNPDVVPVTHLLNSRPLRMHYPAIHESNRRGIHFMQGMCEFLGYALGITIPLITNRPHLYFNTPNPDQPTDDGYWVICSGGKKDFTNKLWGFQNYAKVLRILRDRVRFIQVGDSHENHPRLNGVLANTVGRTSLRQLFELVRASSGVLCGVSLLMHVAAALCKPCVVIAGGREPVQWNSYSNQQYLHTVGMLPCLSPQGDQGACWRSRVKPLGDNTILDEHPCLYPEGEIPKCMTLIDPKQVAELILRYNQQYEKGSNQ